MGCKITEQEQQAYRLRHHEFEGLTEAEAAEEMGINKPRVRQLLQSLKRKAPQLFPILTRHQFLVYDFYVGKGLSQKEIAKLFNITQQSIDETLQRMKDSGMPGIELEGMGDTISYTPEIENQIKQKF